jgi:Domain of unknown function (DUF4333)
VLVAVLGIGGLIAKIAIEHEVASYKVEDEIATQLHVPADQVTCPADLPSRVGATLTCTGAVDGVSRPLLVTVTAVDGSQVNVDITPQ